MSGGFFGFGIVPGGTVRGSVLGSSGYFGPNFIKAAVGGMVATITPAGNSNGPFISPPNPTNQSAPAFAEGTSHDAGLINPDPFVINGFNLQVWGNVQDTSSGIVDWFVVAIQGNHAQNFFTKLSFTDQAAQNYTLTTASALAFNSHYTDPGMTIWEWQPVPFPTLFSFQNTIVTFT